MDQTKGRRQTREGNTEEQPRQPRRTSNTVVTGRVRVQKQA